MSETVTVKSFGEGNPWSSDDGKISLTFFETVFDRNGADFKANWGKKEGKPMVGESLEGEFYEKDGKWRFRKASKPQGGGGEFSGSRKSPDQQASIVRQHSQEMALRFLAGTKALEGASTVPPIDYLNMMVGRVTDWFETDANNASKAATGAGANASPSGASPAPAPSQTPDPQGVHERLYSLLESAGQPGPIATLLTDWIVSTQEAERQDQAIAALEDKATAPGVVRWAREGYEKAHGPLPKVTTDDESPPF